LGEKINACKLAFPLHTSDADIRMKFRSCEMFIGLFYLIFLFHVSIYVFIYLFSNEW